MPPCKSPRNNPPPPPIPQFDTAALNAAVAAAVATAMAEYHSSSSTGAGTPIPTIQVETPVHSKECSYKDFTNCKILSFNGTGGVIVLSQ